MRLLIAFASALYLPLATAQCKSDFNQTDKAGEVRAALACWKNQFDAKSAELERISANLRVANSALETLKAKPPSPASEASNANVGLASRLRAAEEENKRLRTEAASKPKVTEPKLTPSIYSVQAVPFDRRKANCYVAATRVLTSLSARDLESQDELSISGTVDAHRVEITCWLDEALIVTAAGSKPFAVATRVHHAMEAFRK